MGKKDKKEKGVTILIYKNKRNGMMLNEKEYADLRERDAKEHWDALSNSEKENWGSYEEYKRYDFQTWPDKDFEILEY